MTALIISLIVVTHIVAVQTWYLLRFGGIGEKGELETKFHSLALLFSLLITTYILLLGS